MDDLVELAGVRDIVADQLTAVLKIERQTFAFEEFQEGLNGSRPKSVDAMVDDHAWAPVFDAIEMPVKATAASTIVLALGTSAAWSEGAAGIRVSGEVTLRIDTFISPESASSSLATISAPKPP